MRVCMSGSIWKPRSSMLVLVIVGVGKTDPLLRLDKVSYRALTIRVPIEQLPMTFRDAVALCARPTLKYTWIDAICKLQPEVE